jgi:thiamine biosynthesis lipoprotein
MGVAVECLVESECPADAAFDEVEAEFERLEQIFSRFRDDSELSRLNRAGRAVAGGELLEVVQRALEARDSTGGRFDPTVHDAVTASGYDRTFAEVEAAGRAPRSAGVRCGGDVRVDPATHTIALGKGARLDLGGIAKGWSAERGCDVLQAVGPCLVNAGGDLAVRGRPAPGVWPISVETPEGDVTLGLRDGGMATSGRDVRRWLRNGCELHHLIDPATGAPAGGDVLRVTVVGADAVEAEVNAKALFLAGADAAVVEADTRGLPCVVVTVDGRVLLGGGLG